MNHPPTYIRTFLLHKVRKNCHFWTTNPPPMSLCNIKMAPYLDSNAISLESFRSFRGPLFRKLVTGQKLFLLFLYLIALIYLLLFLTCSEYFVPIGILVVLNEIYLIATSKLKSILFSKIDLSLFN